MFSEHSLQENILYKQLHTYGDVALFGVHVCVCVCVFCYFVFHPVTCLFLFTRFCSLLFLIPISLFIPFKLLYSTLPCEYTIFILSIPLPVGIWLVSGLSLIAAHSCFLVHALP